MKKNLLTILFVPLLFVSQLALAQDSVIEDINYNQLEQFIEMAKTNYPKSKIIALNEKKAKRLAPMEALSYLDMFSASYYYRPDERASINPENPYSVTGYQFGISASLGTLVKTPGRIREAKIDYEIAKLESEDYEKVLISEVKSRYYEYILQLKELKLSTQTVQDSKSITEDIALRFERGEIELSMYNAAKTAYNSSISAQMSTEVDYLIAKDQLEEIIGKKLTEL